MPSPLDDAYYQPQQALVTGASSGIGQTFVRHLLAHSTAQVLGIGRRDVDEPLEQLITASAGRFRYQAVDYQDPARLEQFCAELANREAGFDWVLHCAGWLHDKTRMPEKRFEDLNYQQLQDYFSINSVAPMLISRALGQSMSSKSTALCAYISARVGSISDNRLGGWYGYRASKAALNMLLKTQSIEWQRRFPRSCVVALHPGTTDTHLSEPFQQNVPPEKLFTKDYCIEQLLKVIAGLTADNSGEFLAWDGKPIQW